jgi:lipoic acid synthetase
MLSKGRGIPSHLAHIAEDVHVDRGFAQAV